MKPQIKAIYFAVKDMNRAIRFYESIFGRKVSSKDKRMSSFNFKNIIFLLFNPKIDKEKITYGNNIVQNIEVQDINQMLKLIKSKKCRIVLPIQKVGKYILFQAKDTEGNVIEFYQMEK